MYQKCKTYATYILNYEKDVSLMVTRYICLILVLLSLSCFSFLGQFLIDIVSGQIFHDLAFQRKSKAILQLLREIFILQYLFFSAQIVLSTNCFSAQIV